MAVHLEHSTRRYIGLSGDDKPTELSATEEMPHGSSFLENDTGKIFRWDGRNWQYFVPEDEQLYALQLILAELVKLRELVTLATA